MPWVETPSALASAPIYIVANARSGDLQQGQRLGPIEETLRAAGRSFELIKVERPSELVVAARRAADLAKRHQGIVAVAGGDGTISAVVREVVAAGVCLGVIPQGTFNLFARNYGLPLDVAQATQTIVDGHTIPVQIGSVNEHLFLVNASVGLYPRLLQDREQYKRRYGRNRVVAVVAALVTMFHQYRPLQLRLEVDSEAPRRLRTPTLFVGNSQLQLSDIGIEEAQELGRGRLIALACEPIGFLTMVRLMIQGALGRLNQAEEVAHFSFVSMRVHQEGARWRSRRIGAGNPRTGEVAIALDGERHVTRLPLQFGPHPTRLKLIVPMATSRDDEPLAAFMAPALNPV